MARHEVTHSVTLELPDIIEAMRLRGLEPSDTAWVSHVEGKGGGEVFRFACPDGFQVTVCWREQIEEKTNG